VTTVSGPISALSRRALPHVDVGPLAVMDGNLSDAVTFCTGAIASGRGAKVATANLDFVALARKDEVLRRHLAESTLVVADGAPVAWLGRLSGGRRVARAPGVDLVEGICAAAGDRPIRLAIYGSTEDTCTRAVNYLTARHPGVSIDCIVCPPFREQSPEEREADLALLVGARPDLVLIALGCPKQERFIAAHYDRIPGAVWIGVGGTLDFFAGQRKRAPRWAQRAGCEWLVRLLQEPGRLWRRYLVRDLPALIPVSAQCIASRFRPSQ
jgi:N-acetylglucosaminyldiphosphoundecaprenol N-acetyl-beta-D-mannosaminyltransferase